jgi:chemotaxis protein CheY-P-specific phosphatase CheC
MRLRCDGKQPDAGARGRQPGAIVRMRETKGNAGDISFVKLVELIRAAARAMAEPTVTYSEGETLLRAQAAEAQQLAKQMMDERDKLRAECTALRRELAALMDDH